MKPTLAFLIFALDADSSAIIGEYDEGHPHMQHRTEVLGKLFKHHNGFPP